MVLFAADLAWPAVVVVIAVVLLTTQRRAIGRLIERVNSVKYPGGEVGAALPETGPESIKDLLNSLSRDMSEPAVLPELVPAEAAVRISPRPASAVARVRLHPTHRADLTGPISLG